MKTKLYFPFDAVVSGKVMFKKGETYEFSNDTGSVTRWIKRGALPVEESTPEVVVAPEVVVTPEVVVAPEVVVNPEGDPEVVITVELDPAIASLGEEEEVVNEASNKENKKSKKYPKQG